MWTRAELKMRAKVNLRRYYGTALFVSFIANLFSTDSGSAGGRSASGAASGVNTGVGIAGENTIPMEGLENMGGIDGILADVPGAVDSFVSQIDPVGMSVVASILVAALAISLTIGIFLSPIFSVGKNRFYMESRAIGFSAGAGELLWGFRHEYLNIVWTMFLKNFLIFLGTLCCVVPGIYLGYCYYMVPYILAENPDIKATDALRMSKQMMDDQKFSTFILEISFWGWWILGSLACGVGGVLVQPYFDATIAELYAVLRQPFQNRLNGFGHFNPGGGYYDPTGGPGGYGQNYDFNNRSEDYQNNRTSEYSDDYRNGGYTDVTQQQYVSPSERDEFAGAGQEPAGQRNAESIGSTDYGYYERNAGTWPDQQNSPLVQENRGSEVSISSESTSRRGYYLNGEFYPYTEDELRELEENKHKN